MNFLHDYTKKKLRKMKIKQQNYEIMNFTVLN